jgi:hypothetical protein
MVHMILCTNRNTVCLYAPRGPYFYLLTWLINGLYTHSYCLLYVLLGLDIEAGCGQLKATVIEKKKQARRIAVHAILDD